MTGDQCARGASLTDLLDYWVGDLDQASADHVEAHVFECAECADHLAGIAAIATAVGEAVRSAPVQTVVTDSVLNRLSRDGLRIRGYDELTLVFKSDDGSELSRSRDIPLISGTHEILSATSAAQLRQLPSMRLRLIVSGRRGDTERVIGEYGLEHGGAMSR